MAGDAPLHAEPARAAGGGHWVSAPSGDTEVAESAIQRGALGDIADQDIVTQDVASQSIAAQHVAIQDVFTQYGVLRAAGGGLPATSCCTPAGPVSDSVAPAVSVVAKVGLARVLWRFRSASPISGSPRSSAAGAVYVTSVEGYVHALGADGSFRWSYGLPGVPLGSPAVDAQGRVFVATSEGRLYALRPDGQLAWASSAIGCAAAPLWAEGWLYCAARGESVYGMPGVGGPPSRMYVGEPLNPGLGGLAGGLVALGTGRGAALLFRQARLTTRLELRSALSQPLLGGAERWFAVTADGIAALDVETRELLWSAPARRAALSEDQRSLVVEADRELRWLAPETGEVLGRAPLAGDVSAPPALTNAGVALVPLVSGELWLAHPLAPQAARVAEPLAPQAALIGIGQAPPWAPVYDEASARVTVAAGGVLAALELGGGA